MARQPAADRGPRAGPSRLLSYTRGYYVKANTHRAIQPSSRVGAARSWR